MRPQVTALAQSDTIDERIDVHDGGLMPSSSIRQMRSIPMRRWTLPRLGLSSDYHNHLIQLHPAFHERIHGLRVPGRQPEVAIHLPMR